MSLERLLEQSESTRIRRATELLQLRDEMEASLARKTELEREERERDRERMRLGVARDEEELQRMQQIEQQARLVFFDCFCLFCVLCTSLIN